MIRTMLLGAAVAIGAAALPLAAPTAAAQGYNGYDDEITITAPRGYRTGRRSAIGAPEELYEASAVVYTRDLDLRSWQGRRELNYRIAAAARDACRQLDYMTGPNPTAVPSSAECYSDTVKRARWKADRAIDLALR